MSSHDWFCIAVVCDSDLLGVSRYCFTNGGAVVVQVVGVVFLLLEWRWWWSSCFEGVGNLGGSWW